MHLRRVVGALSAALVLAAAVAGCAGDEPEPVPEQPAVEQRSWSDKVCGAFLPLLKAAASPPPAEALSNAETTRAAFGGYLGSVLKAFDQTFTALDGVGPAPSSSGGDRVVVEARATLVTLRTTVAGIKGKEDARSGPAVGGDTVTNLVAALQKRLMLEDPSLNLSAASTELDNEVKNAPSCQETSSYSRRSLLDAQGGYNTNPYTNPVPVPIPSFERLTAVPAPSSKPR